MISKIIDIRSFLFLSLYLLFITRIHLCHASLLSQGKTIYQKRNWGDITLATDGNLATNNWMWNVVDPWMIIDLGDTYSITSVKLHWRKTVPHQIDVIYGDLFQECRKHLLDDFTVCNTLTSTSTAPYTLMQASCTGNARFVGIQTYTNQLWFEIYEIEVFGNPVPVSVPAQPAWLTSCTATSAADGNLAVGKKVFQSSVLWGSVASRAVDGNIDSNPMASHSCTLTNFGGRKYLAVDLAGVYDITHIRIWQAENQPDGYLVNTTIYVSSTFHPCRANAAHLTAVKTVNTTVRSVEIPVNIRGQYVMIEKVANNDPLRICELEVFGTAVTDANVDGHFMPSLPTGNGQLPAKPHIGARAQIWNGLTQGKMGGYTSIIHLLTNNAETIAFSPSNKKSGIVASTVGDGRVISVGNDGYLKDYLSAGGNALLDNAMQWLQGNHPTRRVVDIQNLQLTDQGGDGLIIFWNEHVAFSSDLSSHAITLLQNGQANILLAAKVWYISEFKPDFKRLTSLAGVSFQREFVTWSVNEVTFTILPEESMDDYLPLEYHLDYASYSPQYFIDRSDLFQPLRDLTADETAPMVTSMSQLIGIYRDYIEWNLPCAARPISDQSMKNLILSYNYLLLTSSLPNLKAPGVDVFPGDVPTTNRISQELDVQSTVAYEYHSTGLYLPPGGTLVTQVHSGIAGEWNIRIGCHIDDIRVRGAWERYPMVSFLKTLSTTNISSTFGGLVWLQNRHPNSRIVVTFSGVVKAVYYNARDATNRQQWSTNKNAVAPWADLSGNNLAICARPAKLRAYDDSQIYDLVVNTWDRITRLTKQMADRNPATERREIFVVDVQSKAGWAHNGYPIVVCCEADDTVVNLNVMTSTGSWGMIHEIGHNIQSTNWTASDTHETTNNIFVLYAEKTVFNLPFFVGKYDSPHHLAVVRNAFATSTPWASLINNKIILHAQLAHHFGFELYASMFHAYRQRPKPNGDAEIHDLFFKLASDVTGRNLQPLLKFWGYPMTQAAIDCISSSYPYFFPDDFLTQDNANRANQIRTEFPNHVAAGHLITSAPTGWNTVNVADMLANDVIYLP